MTQWGLDTLFNPAKRHMDEEKRRLQSTREQLGDSSGGKRIDLESGRVTIRRPEDDEGTDAAAGEGAEGDSGDAGGVAGSRDGGQATGSAEPATSGPANESGAARRARLRRAKATGKDQPAG